MPICIIWKICHVYLILKQFLDSRLYPTHINIICHLSFTPSYCIILKCANASRITLSFSGEHFGCLEFSDFDRL